MGYIQKHEYIDHRIMALKGFNITTCKFYKVVKSTDLIRLDGPAFLEGGMIRDPK